MIHATEIVIGVFAILGLGLFALMRAISRRPELFHEDKTAIGKRFQK